MAPKLKAGHRPTVLIFPGGRVAPLGVREERWAQAPGRNHTDGQTPPVQSSLIGGNISSAQSTSPSFGSPRCCHSQSGSASGSGRAYPG